MTRGRAVVGTLCAVGAIVPLTMTLLRFWAEGSSSDFWSLWSAGRAALAGGSVYASQLVFPYPPHSLFLFIPFSLPPFGWGLLLFNLVGIAFFAWAVKPVLPKDFPLILALCSPAALFCLFFGQTSLFVAGFWLLAFQGRWPAVAALTFKPHLGLLAVLSLRNWPDALRTTALAALLVAVSMIAFGADIWLDFADALLRQADRMGQRPRWLVMGVSPAIGYGVWGWIPFAAAAGFLLARNVNAFTAATAALLISPYGFLYDMPVACVGFALAIHRYWTQLSLLDRTALVGGFLVPVIVTLGTWWGPPILLWALSVQVRLPEGPSA